MASSSCIPPADQAKRARGLADLDRAALVAGAPAEEKGVSWEGVGL